MFIGLDVGGTYLKAASLSREGLVLRRLHEPIRKASANDLFAQLEQAVSNLSGGQAVAAVGIGLPGIVDRRTACLRVAPNVPVLNGLPVGEEMSRRVGAPCFPENDANAAALAEAWMGAGRDAMSVLFVSLGTGVGGGIVHQGRIWTGHSGYAGEIGHIQVDGQGLPCGCGSRGCLETLAGAPGWTRQAEALLAHRASTLRGGALDPEAIVARAREGDAVALEVVEGSARALGVGIAASLNLMNLDRVVIGGGVAAAGPFLLDRIVRETEARTFPHVFADCTFRPAELGGDAGVVGAARVGMMELDGRGPRIPA